MPDLIYNVKFQIDQASLEEVSQASSRATSGGGGAQQSFYEQNINNSRKYQAVIKNEINLIVNQKQAKRELNNQDRSLIASVRDYTAAMRASTAEMKIQDNVSNEMIASLLMQARALRELTENEQLLAIAQDETHENFREANQVLASARGSLNAATTEVRKYGQQLLEVATASDNLVSRELALTEAVKAKTDEVRRYNAIVEARGALSTEQEIADYQRATAELNELRIELLKVADAADSVDSSQIRQMNQALKGAGQAATSADRYLSGMAGQMSGVNRLGNNSNQIFLAFGDALQDSAQFSYGFATGMRAVGNNLTFAAEQFSYAYQRAGSMNQLMKEFRKTITGPVGVVVGINAAVTVITMFSQMVENRLKEVRNQGKETSKVFLEISEAFAGVISEGTTDPFGLIKTQKQLEFTRRQFEALNDPLKDYIDNLNEFQAAAVSDFGLSGTLDFLMNPQNWVSGFLANFAPKVNKTLSEFTSNIKAAFGDESYRRLIMQSEAYKELSVEIEKLELKQKAYTEFLKQDGNQALLNATNQFEKNSEAILKLSLNQIGLSDATEQTLKRVESQINALSSLNNLTDVQVLALSTLREEYKRLIDVLNDYENAQMQIFSLETRKASVDAQLLSLQSERGSAQEKYNAAVEVANSKREEEYERYHDLYRAELNRINVQKAAGILSADLADDQLRAAGALFSAQLDLADLQEKNAIRQAKLNQIMSGADMVQSLSQTVSTLNDVFGLSKDIQIAMAVIDGGAAIVKTFAQLGFPAGIPAALAVAARTAATIKQMRETDIGNKSPIGANGSQYSLRTASGFRGQTGFNVSGEEPSYTPTMFGPKSFTPQATINLNVDETGFALYLQGIEGKLANDTMAIQSA